jgi:O-antigen ligase
VITLGLYLLVTSALFPFESLYVFDGKRVLQLILLTMTLAFSVIWAPLRNASIAQLCRLSSPHRYALGLFFLIGLVSALRLDHPAYALIDISMMFLLIMLVAVTAGSRDLSSRLFDKWAVISLSALGIAVVTQELMGIIAGWFLRFEFSYEQALIHFAHPRFYNQLQTWSIPVLAAIPFIFPGTRWIKFICISLLGFQWFLVIAYAARGTTISLLATMALIALWLPERRKFWLKLQLAGVFAGFLIYSSVALLNEVFIPQSQSGEFYAHSIGRPMAHTSGRSTLWKLSLQDGLRHPALGTGPTMYACDSNMELPAHPHSFPLRILGEWGLLAFFLMLFLTVSIGLIFLKNIKSGNQSKPAEFPLKAMLAISLIAGALHACLSGLLIMPASQMAMGLIAGWALSLSGETQSPKKPLMIPSAVLFVSILIAVATLIFAIKEITEQPGRTGYAEYNQQMQPRFWQNGRVCDYLYAN